MDATEQFLSKYPPEMQAITNQLRALVTTVNPQAQEVLYARENHFGYSRTGKRIDEIAYLCPMKDYVRLGFYWGGQLPDPKSLLQGEGKRLRHIKIRTMQQANDPAVKKLLRAAWREEKTRQKQKAKRKT
ncbi:MAG TPA: DUF1801 domain-containing protein [Anaerolineae bacterium]|nr:DUF1801 domain-containing protein [Anaerolineae bacterium]